jgi:hypothetical protein
MSEKKKKATHKSQKVNLRIPEPSKLWMNGFFPQITSFDFSFCYQDTVKAY